MPITKEQFAQRIAGRPQGQSQDDAVTQMLKDGVVTQKDLQWFQHEQALNTDPNKVIRAAEWQRKTKGMTATAADAMAADAYRKGMQIEGYISPDERQRSWDQVQSRRDDSPSILHPKDWWKWKTPAEKHDFIDSTGEAVGGGVGAVTAGVVSGGNPWAAIGGAGVGAAAGKGLAHELGPRSDHNYDLADITKTLLANAALEGGGTAVPAALRFFKPRPGAARITQLFERLNIPVNLPTRTGSNFLQAMLNGAEHMPVSQGIVKRANAKAYKAWEDYMVKVLDNINPQSMTRDDLARVTKQAMEQARGTFNTTVKSELGNVANAVHPQPVTAQSAGQGLQKGLQANQHTLSDWADTAYGNWRDKADALDAVADGSKIQPAWRNLWTQVQAQARDFMPNELKDLSSKVQGLAPGWSRKTVRALNEIAGRFHADGPGGAFSTLSDEGKKHALAVAQSEGVDLNRYMNLDPETVLSLRSNVSRYLRGLPDKKGVEAHYANELLNAIDDAAESMPGNLGQEYGQIRRQFAQGAQATRPPITRTGPGNEVAGQIDATHAPEQVALGLTAPHQASRVQAADLATNPNTMTKALGVPSNGSRPLNETGRLAVENIGKKSEAKLDRVSPEEVRSHLATPGVKDTYDPLMGSANLGKLEDVARPSNLAEEERLYDSDLAKAVDNPSGRADQTFNAMFPKRSTPDVVDTNLSILPDRSQGERAFAQDLVDQSRHNPGAGRFARATDDATGNLVNPGALDGRIKDYGDTVGHVLDPNNPFGPMRRARGELDDAVEAAKHLQAPTLHANTSNTAPTALAMRILSHPAAFVSTGIASGAALTPGAMLSPMHLIGTAAGAVAGAGTAIGAAKALTHPGLAKALTGAATSKALPWVERTGGALARQAGVTFRMPPPMRLQKPTLKGDDAPPPIPGLDDAPPIPGLDDAPPIPGLDDASPRRKEQQ